MMRLSRVLLVAIIALIGALPRVVRAQDTTYRGITLVGNYDPTRDKYGIVVLPIDGANGDSIRAIIQRDLDYSDRFTPLDLDLGAPSALRMPGSTTLNYPLFQKLNAVAIVEVMPVTTGLHVSLHDVARGQVVNVGEFALDQNPLGREWRMGVHRVSDEVHRWVTGERGIAATRMAYVRGTGPQSTLRVIDSDGAFDVALPSEDCAGGPAWHPGGNLIAYATCGKNSRVWILDLPSGRVRTLLGPTRNVSYSTPAYTPDGLSVVFSRLSEAGTDVYIIRDGVGGAAPQRLTLGRGVENSLPTLSPDGRRIVYVGDALGRPELYIMDADGTNAEVLTNYEDSEKNYRADPDWSPDGRSIVYAERLNGRFQIRTINPTGSAPKYRTSEGENEQPAFAPDGRHIVFTSSRTGVRQLWVMDLETGRVRQLTKAPGSRLAAWSPRLGER